MTKRFAAGDFGILSNSVAMGLQEGGVKAIEEEGNRSLSIVSTKADTTSLG